MCSDIRGLYKAVRDRVWVALRVCGYYPGRAVLAPFIPPCRHELGTATASTELRTASLSREKAGKERRVFHGANFHGSRLGLGHSRQPFPIMVAR